MSVKVLKKQHTVQFYNQHWNFSMSMTHIIWTTNSCSSHKNTHQTFMVYYWLMSLTILLYLIGSDHHALNIMIFNSMVNNLSNSHGYVDNHDDSTYCFAGMWFVAIYSFVFDFKSKNISSFHCFYFLFRCVFSCFFVLWSFRLCNLGFWFFFFVDNHVCNLYCFFW